MTSTALKLSPQRDDVPRFRLGQLVATPGALHYCEVNEIDTDELLRRHNCGDWGDLGAEDKASNDAALVAPTDRILSSYDVGPDKLWIITEHNRSVTTILLPAEY